MLPEVYGALSLAVRWCNHDITARGPYQRKKRRLKIMAKVQKHLARATKYQSRRSCS